MSGTLKLLALLVVASNLAVVLVVTMEVRHQEKLVVMKADKFSKLVERAMGDSFRLGKSSCPRGVPLVFTF